VKGRWDQGIPPRNFTWVIRDRLAVSERPGGFAATHRRVRRQEEIIWLKVQGFQRVVSLLASPHNLAAYQEQGLPFAHLPLPAHGDSQGVLADLYRDLTGWLEAGERILVHQDELGDRLLGAMAGFLLWSGRLPGGPEAIAVMERLCGRQMGPNGRQLVAEAEALTRSQPAQAVGSGGEGQER
jgi:hypothetical protein